MFVFNRLQADFEKSRRGVDHAAIVILSGGKPRRDEERLDARAGLKDVSGGAVSVGGRDKLLAVIRVVGGLIDHRQDFAGRDVKDDYGSCSGALLANRSLQLPVGKILNAQIDRQHQIPAGPRTSDAVHVLHDAPVAILDDALGAIFAREPMIERKLKTLLPRVINIGEAQDMAGHFAGGKVAPIFARQVHARNLERAYLLGLGGLQVARKIEKFAVEIARDPPRELLAVELQSRGEPRNLIRRKRKLTRIGPHRIHRCADRKRLAIAVDDGTAMRGNGGHAREARVALACKKAVIAQRKVCRPPAQCECADAEEAEQHVGAPAKGSRGRLARLVSDHGAMTSICCGGGVAMRSLVLATRSTKACVDQALCSSCSWPHSTSRLSRRALRRSSSTNSARARCLQ